MQFGRVENPDRVDFSLPNTHSLSKITFENLNKPSSSNIFIGCPVWADKGYVGKVFPKGTAAKNYLREYCKQFNSIEVNATHYQIPQEKTIEKWKEVATPGFRFCPKFPQIISHRNDFDQRGEWLDSFLVAIHGLEEYLGTSFIQFPPYFKPDKLERLHFFFKQLPKDMSFAVELRNEAWFLNESIKKEWFDLFQEHNITPVITDTSGRRDVLHQMIATDKTFIRFTGNNLHPSDYKRIDDWVTQIINWAQNGVSDIYFFVHEPEKHLCADIATYMIRQLKDNGDFNLKAPRIYSEETGKLF